MSRAALMNQIMLPHTQKARKQDNPSVGFGYTAYASGINFLSNEAVESACLAGGQGR